MSAELFCVLAVPEQTPLTPSLSQGERENRRPSVGETSAREMLKVDLCFPLSLERGRIIVSRVANQESLKCRLSAPASPSPVWERAGVRGVRLGVATSLSKLLLKNQDARGAARASPVRPESDCLAAEKQKEPHGGILSLESISPFPLFPAVNHCPALAAERCS